MVASERIHGKDGCEDATACRKCIRRLNYFFFLDFTGITKRTEVISFEILFSC